MWNTPAVLNDPAGDIPTGVLYPAVEQAIVWGAPPDVPTGFVGGLLTTHQLRRLAGLYPHLFFDDGVIPTNPVSFNHDLGVSFQNTVIQGLSLMPNSNSFITSRRSDFLGRDRRTQPDGFGPVMSNNIVYNTSNVIEIKARAGLLTLSYENYQFVGMIEIAQIRELAYATGYGVLTVISTFDTAIGQQIILEASSNNVWLCQVFTFYLESPSNNQVVFAFAQPILLNPQLLIGGANFTCSLDTPRLINVQPILNFSVYDGIDVSDNSVGDAY